MFERPVAKIASQAEEIPRQCLSFLMRFQLPTQAQFCLSLLRGISEWGGTHRGVGTPPSQLTIPGKPILSRDEDHPLATWTEPLPRLPLPINSPSRGHLQSMQHCFTGGRERLFPSTSRMMELQSGCYPHSAFTWIPGIHIPGFMLEPSPEFTNLVSDPIYLLKR